MNTNCKLAPSVLAADFSRLGEEIKSIERGGAHYLHFDVMDGHFVSNISFGLPVMAGIRSCTALPFDVHLMVEEPLKFIEPFAQAGADIITVHRETANAEKCLRLIRSLGKKPSLALSPGTELEEALRLIELTEMILLMAVEPGMGGQKFKPGTLKKADRLANYAAKNNLKIDIETDGGINLQNTASVLNAGVNVIVAGSAVFERGKTEENTKRFASLLETNAALANKALVM